MPVFSKVWCSIFLGLGLAFCLGLFSARYIVLPSTQMIVNLKSKHFKQPVISESLSAGTSSPGLFVGDTLEMTTLTLNMTAVEAEEAFYRFVTQKPVSCPSSVRLGNLEGGGWDMCIVPPFQPRKPCIVYSFGIRNDWSFDDDISKNYNCVVRSFDPSMKVKTHRRSNLVWFYKTGIGSENTVNKQGWNLRTLQTLLKYFGDDKSYIDYLKIDIDYNEWDSFERIFKEGVLGRVKQLGIEIHTQEMKYKLPRRPTVTSVADFVYYFKILTTLRELGFRSWYWHFNSHGRYKSTRTGKHRTCCYEIVYVNLNFLDERDQRLTWTL